MPICLEAGKLLSLQSATAILLAESLRLAMGSDIRSHDPSSQFCDVYAMRAMTALHELGIYTLTLEESDSVIMQRIEISTSRLGPAN
ncbi:unnamed protein product [Protopolystoma xenopodis]|uniref:Uncharacterized protein n=1 Tax=Protopolystoma xenopodis TaxID=117903 RepID=A0A3S5CL25_9PLAT|nr:unnamed protein product [Protopolystoma xenopodis]